MSVHRKELVSLLSINNLTVGYNTNPVIKQLNLSVEPGEIVALFGPSGSGKSTALKAIAGLLHDATGSIELAGQTLLSDKVNVPTEQRHVGLIFQDYALFPHLTVAENICFGLLKASKSEKEQVVSELLRLVKMSEYIDAYPHQLSGGQQQRVAIVRALATKPELLLFDEAFSNLDPQFRFELIEEMRDILKSKGITAVFVTHNQDEAFAFCDKIAVLHEGKVVQIDTPEHLFSYPKNKFVAEFLGSGVWLGAEISSVSSLNSEWGELPYAGERDLSNLVGQSAEVYLRPHQIGLTESADGVFEVLHERFVGEFYEIELQWRQQSLKIRTHSSYLGKRVNIRVKQPVLNVFENNAPS